MEKLLSCVIPAEVDPVTTVLSEKKNLLLFSWMLQSSDAGEGSKQVSAGDSYRQPDHL